MRKIFSMNYLRRVVKWIWNGKYHILSLLVFITTILYIVKVINFLPGKISSSFSIIGVIILLYQQFTDARQFSDHKPNTFSHWIKSFPTLKPIKIELETAMLSCLGSKAHLSVSIPENASIERKVEILLNEVSNIHNSITKIDDRIDDVANILTKKSKELSSNIENLEKALSSIIAEHIIGNYDRNSFAIILTLCGTLIQIFT